MDRAVNFARFHAILFDLDGTLVDSAPDLAGAANDMRLARGLDALPLSKLRPLVGSGARGMVGRALDVAPGDPTFEVVRDEFLERYAARMTAQTALFEGIAPVLDALDRAGMPWAIVTNKATRFGEPLVHALGLGSRAATLVCGDTTAHSKPHPAPLLEAARRLGVSPAGCVYVGDDRRDVVAGRAAGMETVAVAWGYLGEEDPIEAWSADHVLQIPAELLKLPRMA